jgi:catechol 2,3-dioxygenase-like lactoylglutathione lyase family enzyme
MTATVLEVVSVPVSDQDRTKRFYVETLGFTPEMDTDLGGGGMRWVMLRPPGGGAAVTLVTWFDTMPAGSLRGAVLGCTDLEQTLDALAERGVSFAEDEIQQAPWGRWKPFADPDGNGWVLQENSQVFAG